MAVTGAIFKALTFNGESSRDYGVYITGEGVYDAPKRDVEMITIPGRNGSFPLDHGRYENIEVTYPAGVFADNEADFAEAISDFRNMLCSANGYCRLEDEYNPYEYRMAVYKSGLEVDPTLLKAGEFDITFECKPQRYLKSGEVPVTMGEWADVETHTGNPIILNTDKEVKNLDVELLPIQAGTGTPSPQNVRPITGHDSVTVGVTGVNQWDEQWESGTYNSESGAPSASANAIRSKNGIKIVSGTEYCFMNRTANQTVRLYYYDAGGNFLSYEAKNRNADYYALFTPPTKAKYVKFAIGASATPVTTYANDISINLPSTDTAYHAYYGQSKTVSLPHTVYGAGVGVTSGSGMETMAFADLGDATWTYNTSLGNIFIATSATLPAPPKTAFTGVCTIYSYGGAYTVLQDQQFGYVYGDALCVKDSRFTDATAFKQAMSGVKLCYEKTTPTDLSTTPTDLTLYSGDNVISSDGQMTLEVGELISGVDNPTRFEASPLILTKGYGTLSFNNKTITINNAGTMGQMVLWESATINALTGSIDLEFDSWAFKATDSFTFNVFDNIVTELVPSSQTASNPNAVLTSDTVTVIEAGGTQTTAKHLQVKLPVTITVGTASTTTNTTKYTQGSKWIQVEMTVTYDGNGHITYTVVETDTGDVTIYNQYCDINVPATTAISTLSRLGDPTYIDFDIGEVYMMNSGKPVSLNKFVDLGSDLAVLEPGSNTFTYDNTFTEVKVVPRWWKL